MARRLRFVPPGSMVEVTCRTLQGLMLLRPDREVHRLLVGVLARAQRMYGMRIYAVAGLSNHLHLLLSVQHAQQLSLFMTFVNSNVAREIGRKVGWREKFWGRRYQAIVLTGEEETQISRLRYVLAQGVKEGLVERAEEWPGLQSATALLNDGRIVGEWVDRTRAYEAGRRVHGATPESFIEPVVLELEPLPCWSDHSAEERRRLVADLVKSIEDEAQEKRKDEGKAVLGVAAVQNVDPLSRPLEAPRSPAPWVHSRTVELRQAFLEAYRCFEKAFREASELWREGHLQAVFPAGSFPPRGPWVPHCAMAPPNPLAPRGS